MTMPPMIERIHALHADDGADVDMTDPLRPTGPYGVTKSCEEKIARLEAEKEALPRSERKAINKQLHSLRGLARWCKSREGYVEPRSAIHSSDNGN